MSYKIRWIAIFSLAAVLVAPAWAYDDEDYKPPEDKNTVIFGTGYQGSSAEDSLHRVAEYDVTDAHALFGLKWESSPLQDNRFDLHFKRLTSDYMSGDLKVEASRFLTLNASVDGLPHRLDHDPVSNLSAVSAVKVVRSEDFEPGAEYRIRRRLYQAGADFRPANVEGLTFRLGFREEQRHGRKQVVSTGHCTSCHVVARGRDIDRSATDGTVGVHFARGGVDLDYQVTARNFSEDGTTPMRAYERAYHPGLPAGPSIVTPFNDRVYFQNGTFPINQIPSLQRTTHRLKARTGFDNGGALNFTVMYSDTENTTRGIGYEFAGYRARYSWKPTDTLRVNLYAQHDELENDPVYVNLLDLNGLMSAPVTSYGGTILTFEEWRRLVDDPTLNFTDYTRNSTMDRSDTRIGADAVWRAMKRGSLRAGYRYRVVDRDNVVLSDGTGESTSHTLKLGWNQRLAKKLRWNNSLTYRTVDNPYVNHTGAVRAFAGFREDGFVVGFADTDPLNPPGPTPKSPLSLQYYQLHELRVAHVSNVPSGALKFRSNARWSPSGKWALSGNLRYQDYENDELNYSTWQQDTLGMGASFWMAPANNFHFTLGYDVLKQETDTLFAVPLMDG